ncbi:FG-GAP and VCBS repeat-containing protein [Streptomyces sp. NPDC052225]|uniref:FG-GAP and VCBS repeat-containing protein n=1 Tax=Streptomyces sp. NPDC052225 TaxID=3154949 RepID=UPI0034469C48
MRVRNLALLCAAALTTTGLALSAASPATAQPAGTGSDFNGDGYTDLAVGVPAATVAGHAKAGYVNVVWGGAGGPGKHGSTTISQNSPSIPGTSESGDRFGSALSPADLNGDGYADLAVSAPDETLDVPGEHYEGAVYVLWGSAHGLTSGTTTAKGGHDEAHIGALLATGDYDHDGRTDVTYSSSSEEGAALFLRTPGGAAPTVVRNWHFAGPTALATADFDGDGGDDLAVTYSGMEDQGTFVMTKTAGGDGDGWRTTWSTPDHGAALAAGDFDADGTQDLAIGLVRPNSEVETTYCPQRLGGAVALVLGKPGTTLGGAAGCTTQDSPYVGGAAEAADDFGASLATVHDTVHDGHDALLVGTPHEAVGAETAAGAYTYLEKAYGEPRFLGSNQTTQNSSQVAGTAEAGDRFGATLAAADYDGDRLADFAIGAPGENGSTGGVWFHKTDEEPPYPDTVALTPTKLGLSGAVGYGTALAR